LDAQSGLFAPGVRRDNRADDTGAVRAVLLADAMDRRPENHSKSAAAFDGLVSKERTHFQRRHRRLVCKQFWAATNLSTSRSDQDSVQIPLELWNRLSDTLAVAA